MRIGIMGGTFNPVHNIHLLLAEFAKEDFDLDWIIFITGGNPPHKQQVQVVDASHRFEMVKLAIDDQPYFKHDDYEIKKVNYSYTSDTLAYLKQKYPKSELFFIIGSDSLLALPTWHEPEKIVSLCNILVFERIGYELNQNTEIERLREEYQANIFMINAPKFEISSSMIRQRLKNDKTVRYLLPNDVIEYINEHNLYKGDDLV